jgi:hypothetical protein
MPRRLPIAALSALVLGPLSPNLSAQGPSPRRTRWSANGSGRATRTSCKEVYDFRSDGTVQVLSGTEKTSNVYTIAAEPGRGRFLPAQTALRCSRQKAAAELALLRLRRKRAQTVLAVPGCAGATFPSLRSSAPQRRSARRPAKPLRHIVLLEQIGVLGASGDIFWA